MKNWIIPGVIALIALLVVGVFIVNGTIAKADSSASTPTPVKQSCSSGSCNGSCSGSCNAGEACGCSNCAAKTGGSCGCGK